MIHESKITGLKTVEHNVDFCVIGGGLAGMFAAISAARHGSKVLLMQDRSVLGGNASSEIRMWVRGAYGNRETGLLEEIALENIARNPSLNFSIWDTILYEKVKAEDNITLLMDCACNDAIMQDDKIISIQGYQSTTQQFHVVYAKLFSDCSGDSILAPLTGAEYRMGRECQDEFGESIAPAVSDNKTMGMSCLIQFRETTKEQPFVAPKWAYKLSKEHFQNKSERWCTSNFWWLEVGGTHHSIDDTEELKHELLKLAYGTADYIKNYSDDSMKNWALDWIGFLPGKRESRRYVGDHILTQNDVSAEGRFDDLVAYGGWSMDDHHPEGFHTKEKPTIFHPAPSPYGIPYRSLYSKNIRNLMFAGRNISATHAALSSTRVMATCAIMGQAVGTAAAIAVANTISPRGVFQHKLTELQQTLMDDDCYLPFRKRSISPIMKQSQISAKSEGVELLIDGIERDINGINHAYVTRKGAEIVMTFTEATKMGTLRIVFDSDLERKDIEDNILKEFPMRCNIFLNQEALAIPKTLVKEFEVYAMEEYEWKLIHRELNNYQRLCKIPLNRVAKQIKVVPIETWGHQDVRIYALEVSSTEL